MYFREVSAFVYHSLRVLGRKLIGVGHVSFLRTWLILSINLNKIYIFYNSV